MNTAGMVQSSLCSHGSSCDVVLPLGICEKQGMERLAAVLCLGRRGIWLSAAQPGSLPAAIKPAVQQQQGCELQGSCPFHACFCTICGSMRRMLLPAGSQASIDIWDRRVMQAAGSLMTQHLRYVPRFGTAAVPLIWPCSLSNHGCFQLIQGLA